jgi:hypothetical protein
LALQDFQEFQVILASVDIRALLAHPASAAIPVLWALLDLAVIQALLVHLVSVATVDQMAQMVHPVFLGIQALVVFQAIQEPLVDLAQALLSMQQQA